MHKLAKEARILILEALDRAGSGHTGGSLSIVEILIALYYGIMKHNPKNPFWEERDRFILSKGHGVPALYVILGMLGYYEKEEVFNLRKFGSMFQGHPDKRYCPILETSSGSLGQGFSIGIGMAIAGKYDKKNYHIYVLLGDGELNEGQVWEAAMFAGNHNLDNLTAIVDLNGFQLDGKTSEINDLEPLMDKFKSFKIEPYFCDDGHDIKKLKEIILKARDDGKPSVVIAKTIKGKGGGIAEGNNEYHGKVLDTQDKDKAIAKLLEEKEEDYEI